MAGHERSRRRRAGRGRSGYSALHMRTDVADEPMGSYVLTCGPDCSGALAYAGADRRSAVGAGKSTRPVVCCLVKQTEERALRLSVPRLDEIARILVTDLKAGFLNAPRGRVQGSVTVAVVPDRGHLHWVLRSTAQATPRVRSPAIIAAAVSTSTGKSSLDCA